MIITAWRIVKKKHRRSAFSGEGARRFGGRWNSKGVAVVYTSESPSLAVLEVLVHLQRHEILDAYLLVPVTFSDALVEQLDPAELPPNWREDPAPTPLQDMGDEWADKAAAAVLRVPSVIIDGQWNYLLNPDHADFSRVKRGRPKAFQFDPRLVK